MVYKIVPYEVPYASQYGIKYAYGTEHVLRTYDVLCLSVIIIACKVISGKYMHPSIIAPAGLAPQCHAFHLYSYWYEVINYLLNCTHSRYMN